MVSHRLDIVRQTQEGSAGALLILPIVVCGAATAGSLLARSRGHERLAGILKLVAASSYVALALGNGALESVYGQLILTALLLSWLGDAFLTGSGSRAFMAGLAVFLLAHLVFGLAFWTRGVAAGAGLWGGAAMMVFGYLILRWLGRAGISPTLRRPVVAYVIAIGLMVALGVGTAALEASIPIMAGVQLFALSDVFVARDRFVNAEAINAKIGLPIYFAAQLLLASSIG